MFTKLEFDLGSMGANKLFQFLINPIEVVCLFICLFYCLLVKSMGFEECGLINRKDSAAGLKGALSDLCASGKLALSLLVHHGQALPCSMHGLLLFLNI